MPTMQETAARILSPAKGLLVADEYAESPSAAGKDGLPPLVRLALGSARVAGYASGVLLSERSFAARSPVDTNEKQLLIGTRLSPPRVSVVSPRRTVEQLASEGADFVEWRANRRPGDVRKGDAHIDSRALARGASEAQAADLLPIITVAMPDIGNESLAVTEAVTTNALLALRRQLADVGVDPTSLLLRVNAVVPGLAHPVEADPQRVARATLRVLERALPDGLPGVLILSGGRPLHQACASLSAITSLAAERSAPWRITFGFSRPLFAASVGVIDGHSSVAAEDKLVESCREASESVHDHQVGVAS